VVGIIPPTTILAYRSARVTASIPNAATVARKNVQQITGLAMACRPSVDFCGYWQRAKAA
jgi:hypothetical protein